MNRDWRLGFDDRISSTPCFTRLATEHIRAHGISQGSIQSRTKVCIYSLGAWEEIIVEKIRVNIPRTTWNIIIHKLPFLILSHPTKCVQFFMWFRLILRRRWIMELHIHPISTKSAKIEKRERKCWTFSPWLPTKFYKWISAYSQWNRMVITNQRCQMISFFTLFPLSSSFPACCWKFARRDLISLYNYREDNDNTY